MSTVVAANVHTWPAGYTTNVAGRAELVTPERYSLCMENSEHHSVCMHIHTIHNYTRTLHPLILYSRKHTPNVQVISTANIKYFDSSITIHKQAKKSVHNNVRFLTNQYKTQKGQGMNYFTRHQCIKICNFTWNFNM